MAKPSTSPVIPFWYVTTFTLLFALWLGVERF